MLGRVFESFTQADRSLDRSEGGLGLGLALVKGLVELHGGEVRAESSGLGQGAEFTVSLPIGVTPAETVSIPTFPEAVEALGPMRVLVVEDNEDAAETFRDLLELFGCEVEVAYSGPAGLEAARRFLPGAVLCDIGLPGLNGYEVAKALRQIPELARALLVAVTGYGQEEDRQRAREAGFDLHLTKPVQPAELEKLFARAPQHTLA
jgi:CheY-like chemotaxis protein